MWLDWTGERMAVRLLIDGRVQGVGYRAWLAREAGRSRLDGWVRNRSDGRVEALLVGDAAAIDRLIVRCKVGPALARVEQVEIARTDETAPAGFSQRATF